MLFDFDGTFFVHLAWFVLLMILLSKWLFTPYFELLQQRKAATEKRVEVARKRLDEIRYQETQLQAELEAYRQQVSQKRQEARREYQRQADAIRYEADRKADQELAQAEIQLQFESEKIKARISQQIPEYVQHLKLKVLKDT